MKKLLIIDDDCNLFNLLNRLLAPDGFSSSHAADGAAGLQALDDGAFDAVILDIMLPGMDGMEILRRIRSNKAHQTIPVLMLTARGEESDLVAGLEAGADDYLAKPFRSKELSARLGTLLRRAARSGEGKTPDNIVVGDLVIDKKELVVTVNGQGMKVSMPEIHLLDLLTATPGTVVGRQHLYQSIFGRKAYIEDRSLEMLVSRLRKKLGSRPDGGDRIRAVRGEGYMFLLPGGG